METGLLLLSQPLLSSPQATVTRRSTTALNEEGVVLHLTGAEKHAK